MFLKSPELPPAACGYHLLTKNSSEDEIAKLFLRRHYARNTKYENTKNFVLSLAVKEF